MDPLGFGLENYDAIGRWRTQDGNAPIDASGVLPNGVKFSTPAEMRAILKADKDIFTLALTEKLLIYATGRDVAYSDRAALNDIVARTEKQGGGVRTLLHEVVLSPLFQTR